MVLQIGVLAETPRTDVTLERPRPAVHVHVRFQVSRSRERFRTQGALVGFFLFEKTKENIVSNKNMTE